MQTTGIAADCLFEYDDNIGNIVCINYFFFFYLIKTFKPFTGFYYGYILMLYYKCYITK